MNCPGCGAAMQLAGNRRHFRCDHCGNYHFPEETGDGVAPLGEVAGIDCPVCRLPLQAALIDGESVHYCGHCRGFLTATAAFGRIVTERRKRHGPHERVTEPFDPADLRRRLACPDCRGRMEAHPYFGGGNAVVDTCDRCNLIWLDAGELAVIERYVPCTHHIEPALNLARDGGPAPDLLRRDAGRLDDGIDGIASLLEELL
jgi:Zn-finger nucleic acid-binding protein